MAEIAALKVSDIRLNASKPLLTVRCGKGGKRRAIQLSGLLSPLRKHLAEFLEWKGTAKEPTDPDAPLFATRMHGKWKHYTTDALKYQFKQALRDAGIRPESYSIHCCRHTALTYLYEKTKNLRWVQDIAGHSSPTITAHYAAIVNGWKVLEEAGEGGLYD